MKDICIIRAILPDVSDAKHLAMRLVSSKLAVSCHVMPVSSVYRWGHRIVSEKEAKLEILTVKGLFDKINEFIQSESFYNLTEVMEVSEVTQTSDEIKNWVLQNTI